MEINEINNFENKIIKTSMLQNIVEIPQKKVTYDDILNSLNLKVNNGKLEYIQSSLQTPTFQTITQQTTLKTTPQKQHLQPTPQTSQKKQVSFHQELSPELKNSSIYNKYFKDYKDPFEEEEPQKIMTREEYKQFIIQDYINKIKAKKRISEIKSKKILFSNSSNQVNQPTNISQSTNLNKLFHFSKR